MSAILQAIPANVRSHIFDFLGRMDKPSEQLILDPDAIAVEITSAFTFVKGELDSIKTETEKLKLQRDQLESEIKIFSDRIANPESNSDEIETHIAKIQAVRSAMEGLDKIQRSLEDRIDSLQERLPRELDRLENIRTILAAKKMTTI